MLCYFTTQVNNDFSLISDKVACIEHIAQLCHCHGSRKCLRYRYTLDELPAMIRGLGKRVEGYELWSHNVKAVFNAKGAERVGKSFGQFC